MSGILSRDFTVMGSTNNVWFQRTRLVENPKRRATLVFVMPWIEEREDLYSYITTCSELYNAGIPFLLGFHYVITSRNISQFYQFLQSKSSAGFLALRSLELVSNPNLHGRLGSDAVNSLAEVLRSARKLRHIQVTGDLLIRYRALYKALASLSSLNRLDLHGVWGYEPAHLKLLSQLQSPLRVLKMGETEDDLDIIVTLANFRHTLEELQLEKTKFCYSPTSLCYPNLTYLHVTSIDNLRLSSFIPAFPNLRTLNFSCSGNFDDEDEDIRDSNIRFQTHHPSQRWYLTSLAGDMRSLYTLGLQSEVSVVSTDVTDLYDADPELADACLTPLCPLQLSLQNDDEYIDDASWLRDTIATNCNELVRLSLSFTLTAEGTELSDYLGECLDPLFEELNLLSESKPHLRVLDIEICGAKSTDGSNSAHNFMGALAARASQAVSTLKVIKIAIKTAEVRVSHWTCGKARRVTPIPSKERADSIIDSIVSPLLQAYHDA